MEDPLCNTQPAPFGQPTDYYEIGIGPHKLLAHDMTGNGTIDLVVASNINGDGTTPAEVTILHGAGDGTFGDGLRIDAKHRASDVVVGDFGGSGKVDIAILVQAGPDGPDQEVVVVLQDSESSERFGPQTPIPYAIPQPNLVPHDWRHIHVMDVNGDGRQDLVFSAYRDANENMAVLLQQSSAGSFSPLADGLPILMGGNEGFIVGDCDADQRLDVVGYGEQGVSIQYQNAGDGMFSEPEILLSGYSAYAHIADLNLDGKLDILTTAEGNNFYSFFQDADLPGTWIEVAGDEPSAGGRFEVANLNGDSSADVITLRGDINLGSTTDPGRYSSGGQLPVSENDLPYSIASGDFNGDGLTDVAILHQTTGAQNPGFVRVFLQEAQ